MSNTIAITTPPAHGTATVTGGLVVYKSTDGYTGPDSYGYRITYDDYHLSSDPKYGTHLDGTFELDVIDPDAYYTAAIAGTGLTPTDDLNILIDPRLDIQFLDVLTNDGIAPADHGKYVVVADTQPAWGGLQVQWQDINKRWLVSLSIPAGVDPAPVDCTYAVYRYVDPHVQAGQSSATGHPGEQGTVGKLLYKRRLTMTPDPARSTAYAGFSAAFFTDQPVPVAGQDLALPLDITPDIDSAVLMLAINRSLADDFWSQLFRITRAADGSLSNLTFLGNGDGSSTPAKPLTLGQVDGKGWCLIVPAAQVQTDAAFGLTLSAFTSDGSSFRAFGDLDGNHNFLQFTV